MSVEIKMPQLSDTMSSGKILEWSKKVGDSVSRGDILALVETDKANLEIEAFHSGTLIEIRTPVGETAQIGEIIALIGEAGEVATPKSLSAPQKSPEEKTVSPIVHTQALSENPAISSMHNIKESTTTAESQRIKASPLARKIAEDQSIDLRQVKGSGPNGRIIKKDLLKEESASLPLQQSTPSSSSLAPKAAPEYQAQAKSGSYGQSSSSQSGIYTPLTKMRETIAKRMVESVTQNPHFYTTATIIMDEAVKLREHLKEKQDFKGISINHLVIKAAAYALQNERRVNACFRENQLYDPPAINIGIITAVPDGLLIPVIKDTNTLNLKDLVFEARAAVDRARAGRPNANDLSGGTFSISNMGMFDVENFTAIINPGQGAILAVSSILEEAVVRSGQIVIAKRMRVTLSVDHRIIDGVMAGTFLKFFKDALEMPALLFV
jgi:pyruvate dehydrogenase E2 component (dihydrolipoamide acetyltransferase)